HRRIPIAAENRGTGGFRLPFFILVMLLFAGSAMAYVGPGAGFGIVTSFLVFLNAIFVSLLSALIWPVAIVIKLLRRRRREYSRISKRVVILGLDGFSPDISERMMTDGEMPNLEKLCNAGTFSRLGTTCPGISPVAWSSFQTGVNPGKHGIFDFLTPDRKRYLAKLSSVHTGTAPSGVGLGPIRRTVMKPFVKLLRKGIPFWNLLKRYGIRSTVLRVPITYPPEPFDGHLLSGMCVPDLRGTQGSYTIFTEDEPAEAFTGGIHRKLQKLDENRWTAELPGLEKVDGEYATVAFELVTSGKKAVLRTDKGQLELKKDVLSDWFELLFRSGRSKVRGISKFCLTEDSGGKPLLYSTAVHVDPFSPSVPISHPVHYSRYLAGLYGPYATLGLAEDTWALSNGAISENTFLEQAWSIYEERKKMFFDALKRTRDGLVVCVFDTSDRIQHMFWGEGSSKGSPVNEMYRRMDSLIGETAGRLGRKDMLIVMSDHGFTSFHTCIDFNRWLLENGYLFLEEGIETVDTSFRGVDWSRTRAWSMGLAGIMLNLRGREGRGIVEPGIEASGLLDDISEKLLKLENGKGERVISAVYRSGNVYSGPYVYMGPDLVIGTESGYRSGWSCVTGGIGKSVIYPNHRHWNGDHCHDHRLVPGTLASNVKLNTENATILDMAPTVLRALGAAAPAYMEGKSLIREGAEK
ncbi:MAG: alkaline phosphatase family protein, partial [Candidatus Aegiribacteria sp.]|nr:alkaline phosphatase family protein [Candidatus Aegiribacteria sp.]